MGQSFAMRFGCLLKFRHSKLWYFQVCTKCPHKDGNIWNPCIVSFFWSPCIFTLKKKTLINQVNLMRYLYPISRPIRTNSTND